GPRRRFIGWPCTSWPSKAKVTSTGCEGNFQTRKNNVNNASASPPTSHNASNSSGWRGERTRILLHVGFWARKGAPSVLEFVDGIAHERVTHYVRPACHDGQAGHCRHPHHRRVNT